MKQIQWFGLPMLCMVATGLFAQTPVRGRYVRVAIPRNSATLSLAEVQIFSKGENVARKGSASQSSVSYRGEASRAIDGNCNTSWGGNSITHTVERRSNPWWEVRLSGEFPIEKIILWNRHEIPDRLYGCSVMILDQQRRIVWEQTLPKPNPKDTVLVIDGSAPKSAQVGKRVSGIPATPAQAIAAYEKKETWIDTVLAVLDKLPDVGSMNSLVPILMRDFPAETEAIRSEFGGTWIYKSKLTMKPEQRYHELALRYTASVQDTSVRKILQSKVGEVKTIDALALFRKALRDNQKKNLLATALSFFQPEAMARAINAYTKKYPGVYDADALTKQLDDVKAAVAAYLADEKNSEKKTAAIAKVLALNRAVYLCHPAVDFKEILFVRRSLTSPRGLPQNWQGNSSMPLHGYVNDVVRAPVMQDDDKMKTIYSSESFVGDVDLDFDAERIMFSTGKANERGWRVYEKNLDDSPAREVTPGDQSDIDFYDPCYLPDGRRLFVSTSGFHGVPCVTGSDYVGNLHLMEKDGSIRRLVFDQDNSWCPMVMSNGRILYLRWEYTDSAHYFSRVLMTMNPDGSDQQEFFGSGSYWPNSCFYARTLPGSTTKFVGVVGGHHGLARQGQLALFDVARGRIETDGVVQTIPGYGKPVPNKTRDQLVNGVDPLFLHPYPLSDELFLVSMKKSGVNRGFILALVDIYDNMIPLWQSTLDNLFEPLPLKKQPKPVLPVDRIVKGDKECTVYMVGAQHGPGLQGVPAGKVKSLRVFSYEYSPRNTGGHYHIGMEGPWDVRVFLGTVKVEEDGSCRFRCPANTPISVQTLDENGQSMQQMRSWLIGMPGETIACMGCHEKQNATAPRTASLAGRKPAQQIQPWYGPRRGFSFVREVQTVLDRSCVGCHNDKSTAKTMLGEKIPSFENTPLHGFSTAYFNLMKYVRRNGPEGDYHILTPLEFFAGTSELVQILRKGHHGVKLNSEEWDRLITWIDIDVPYWGTWTERETARDENTAKRCLHNLARRAEMAKKYANVDYNPEVIVNPYVPAVFKAPDRHAAPAPAPVLKNWPLKDPKAAQGSRETIQLNIDGHVLSLVKIPAGEFVMGSNGETPVERPMSAVKIEKPFWMATTEISQAQMRQFDKSFDNGVYDKHYKDQVNRGYYMGDQDPDFAQPGHEDFPAIRISWKQANDYCDWLSRKFGRTFRLPTEAQWEWACRAGSDTPMNYGGFSDDFSTFENLADYTFIELAVIGVDPKPMKNPPPLYDYELRDRRFNDGVLHLAKIASYAPNAWGLHDMHGNVAEWTRSAYRPYPYNANDGRNNLNVDEQKVVRGGSWRRRQIRSTSAWRWGYPGWMRPFDVGFRVIIEE